MDHGEDYILRKAYRARLTEVIAGHRLVISCTYIDKALRKHREYVTAQTGGAVSLFTFGINIITNIILQTLIRCIHHFQTQAHVTPRRSTFYILHIHFLLTDIRRSRKGKMLLLDSIDGFVSLERPLFYRSSLPEGK